MALPPRRRPLVSKTQLRRTGPPKRRAGVRRVSPRRQAELDNPARLEARERVMLRDGGCRLAGHQRTGRCFGRLTVHHLHKAGQGGPYNELNLLCLCAWHNDWIETSEAAPVVHAWGLVKRRGDTYDDVWARLAAAGIVTYTWTGQPLAAT